MNCPCKGCTKRWVSETSRCHQTCTEYKEWAGYMKKRNLELSKQKDRTDSISSVLFGHRRKR